MQDATPTRQNESGKLCRRWLFCRLPLELALAALIYLAAQRNGQARDLQIMTIVMAAGLQLASQIALLSALFNRLRPGRHPRQDDPPAVR